MTLRPLERPLERPLAATIWELRTAWATRKPVSLRLDRRANVERVRGRIDHVAASGFYVLVADEGMRKKGGPLHVPVALVLSVRSPHFTEPLDAERPPEERADGQTTIYDFLEEDER